jgi:hypothetical protein
MIKLNGFQIWTHLLTTPEHSRAAAPLRNLNLNLPGTAPLTKYKTMNNSPTALFDSYEQDFQQFIETIREKLESDGKDERGGEYDLISDCPVSVQQSYTFSSVRTTQSGVETSRNGTG